MPAAWLLAVAGSLAAALSPNLLALLPARAAQGAGVGLMVAGGLADVPRRLPAAVAGRMTGALIAGTALGGLLGRVLGYAGNFVGWRGAFALGGAGVLAVVYPSLRGLPFAAAGAVDRPPSSERVPLSLLAGGLFILFVSVGMFDLLPYHLTRAPFHLSSTSADLVYLVFIPATIAGVVAGRAVDRFGTRTTIIATAAGAIALMLVGLTPSLPAVGLAAMAGICGTVGLHVAHSGAAAAYGRGAVGRYLAAYYVGGAAAAPLTAAGYLRWGWIGVVLPLSAATALVGLLAASRKEPHRTHGQELDLHLPPAGGLG